MGLFSYPLCPDYPASVVTMCPWSPHPLHGKSGKTGMEDTDIGDPMNYRAKLANASCRTARSGLAVSGKIILAGGSGIFLKNPAQPGHGHLMPVE